LGAGGKTGGGGGLGKVIGTGGVRNVGKRTGKSYFHNCQGSEKKVRGGKEVWRKRRYYPNKMALPVRGERLHRLQKKRKMLTNETLPTIDQSNHKKTSGREKKIPN